MSSPVPAESKPAVLKPPRPDWRARIRGIVLRLGLYPLLLLTALGLGQRWLIYHPIEEASLPASAAGFEPGQAHDVTTATADGLTLHGWHVLADDRTCRTVAECEAALARARWVVLYLHGNGGHRGHRVADCQTFAGLGADVLLFDYRGYGDNDGSPSETGLTADARAIWNYATRERHVPPERILLYGESMGGGVATRLAADLCQAGTPPAGLILLGTFSSLTEVAGYHYPWLPVNWLLIDRYPSIKDIAAVTCPILQFHGTRDHIVPVESGRQLFAAARAQSASGVPKEFVEAAHVGHNDFSERELREPLRRFLERLEQGVD